MDRPRGRRTAGRDDRSPRPTTTRGPRHYWDALLAGGGAPSQCGWLKDRFGVSWQIVPDRLTELMASPDRAARNRAVQAMLKMTKLDVAELERAAAG